MRWNSAYSVRQPPMPVAAIRKRSYGSNTGIGLRSYSRNGIVSDISRNDSIDGKDYLCHESGDFLQHFGILGMKWGVRRYQNEDGSYTEEGKKRYGSVNTPESKTWKKRDAEELSDEELNRRNLRLQREKQYKDLMTKESERERSQLKKDIIKKVIIAGAVGLAATAMRGHYKKAIDIIANFAKQKVKPLKVAGVLKSILKNKNIPDQASPVKEIVGKHVGKISPKLINHWGAKIYANGPFESPIIKNRPYWRGL